MRTFANTVRSERGTTIVEVLIVAFLTALVAAAAMEFYVTQHKTWLVENDIAELQYNARATLDEIAGGLRMGGYHLRNHPAYEVRPDTLVIYFRNEITTEVDTLTYFVQADSAYGSNLYRQPKDQSPSILAENIESLSLTKLGPNLIDIAITARSYKTDSPLIAGDGYRRRTYSTQVRLRNTF